MNALVEAIIDLIGNSPPEKSSQLATAIEQLSAPTDISALDHWAGNAGARARLATLVKAWRTTAVSSMELAGMIRGASVAYHRAKREQEIELVWTGPSSTLIPTRKTEQALIQVIDAAQLRLFITSFVAYDVSSVMNALSRALERGVRVSMLLEACDKDGGGISVDAIATMKAAMPTARMLSWRNKGDVFAGGKVHAKVAVADETVCFISSANLTGHAMEKNMEAGVLIRGGTTPRSLQRHLEALEMTHIIEKV